MMATSNVVAGIIADIDAILQQLARQPASSTEPVDDLIHYRDNRAERRPDAGRIPGQMRAFVAAVFSTLAKPVT